MFRQDPKRNEAAKKTGSRVAGIFLQIIFTRILSNINKSYARVWSLRVA